MHVEEVGRVREEGSGNKCNNEESTTDGRRAAKRGCPEADTKGGWWTGTTPRGGRQLHGDETAKQSTPMRRGAQ